jgi:hypothetical protein
MLLLEKSAASELVLTLKEKTTVSNPTYLFVFQSDNSGVSYSVIAADEATTAQKERFNQFTITEGVNDQLNGSVLLGPVGTYHYFVYAQTSTTNLDADLANELVERGEMRLVNAETSAYVENDITVTYTVN